MEIYHDEYEPFDFIIPVEQNDIIDSYDMLDSYDIVDPIGYGMGHALYATGYPEIQLSQFNDLTHDIYYYWNGFNNTGRSAVLNNFNNFHPLDNILFDKFNSWDDVDRYWYIPDSYFVDGYLSTDGWSRGYALLAYMKAVSDKYLKEHFKKECESYYKSIARAIWISFNSTKFLIPLPVNAKIPLTVAEKQQVRNNYKNSSSLNDGDIDTVFNAMINCHEKKITNASGGINSNNIEKFLKKICKEGITNAAASFKKYLLLKKKYLDKKTLKKL